MLFARKQLLQKTAQRNFASIVYPNAYEATKDIRDGDKIALGGFGLCGIPEKLIDALVEHQVKDLTCFSSNAGTDQHGLGKLLQRNQIKVMYSSYLGANPLFERQYLTGQLELNMVPQGTLAEKFRCGGYGIPAFYTPTGHGTLVEDGGFPTKYDEKGNVVKRSMPKETRHFNGRSYILEESIRADFALVKGHIADEEGNVIFRKAARNFNPDVAKCGRVTIVEVEKIVKKGELDPDQIHLPSNYVQRVVLGENYERVFENLNFKKDGKNEIPGTPDQKIKRERIARRAAKELHHGMYVNLGIGIPTLTALFVPKEHDIQLQSENGFLGLGEFPAEGQQDHDLINAGKQTVTVNPGAVFFGSSDSFGMIRGAHIDVCILGAFQVSQEGDMANWVIPGKKVNGMGGAMDLVSGAKKHIIVMEHMDKGGKPKLRHTCSLPVTGRRCVDLLITDMGVFSFANHKMQLDEIATGITVEDVRAVTEADFTVSDSLKKF